MTRLNRTTPRHFKLFQKEAEKWIPILGISNWRIEFDHCDWEEAEDGDGGARAWYSAQPNEKIAGLYLSKDWCLDKVTDKRVKRSGFHEAFHVRLSAIEEMLMARGFSETEVSRVLHETIYTFENHFYGSD